MILKNTINKLKKKSLINIFSAGFFVSFFLSSALYGESGELTGKIYDKSSGEELIGATVYVEGAQLGTISNVDGTYSLDLAPGKYTLICSYVSYEKVQISNIEITSNSIITKNIGLTSETVGLASVVIKGRRIKNTENSVLSVQKMAVSLVNAISAQEISRNGDSEAASALKRVSGISVEGGKYVYVRGLSDRYSMTTLNGAEIPGLDPNRNSVQMDLFPSSIINNITVHKTFSPELPGSFAGGFIDIETKDFPDKLILRFSNSIGYNNNSNLRKDFLTYEGGKYDFLAIEDGSRTWPVNSYDIPYLFENNNQLDEITRSFNKNMDVGTKTSFLNHSHSFSIGDQVKLGEKSLGYNASLSYKRNYKAYTDGETGRYKLTGPNEDILNTERLLSVNHGEEEVLIGAMFSTVYKLSADHKIGLVGIHNRSGNKSASFLDGSRDSDEIGSYQQTRELEYLQRSFSSAQLKGSHFFLNKMDVDWQSTFTKANQLTPDLRYLTNSYYIESADTSFSIEKSKYALPARYSREMNEYNIDTKVDAVIPFSEDNPKTRLKFGFSNVFKRRTFTEQRIDINSQNNSFTGSVEDYFSDNNIGQAAPGTYGIYVQNASELRNNYTAHQNVLSGYALVDWKAREKLMVQIGGRIEAADIFIKSFDSDSPSGSLNNVDFLPAVTINYNLKKDMSLRFAATRTIARPTFRELAPYASYDYATGETKIGNGSLKRTLIDNIDLRWETFLNPGEILSLSAFYKNFSNPIETTFNPVAANPELSWKNVEDASLFGIELEIRKKLDFIPAIKNFKLGGNFTLVKSTVSIDSLELSVIKSTDPDHADTRVMYGQSPYVINSFLAYANKSLGLDASLNYNLAAKKLVVIIVSGTPNVYEQAFHSLNFNVSKEINEHFSMRFSVNNILDDSKRKTYSYNNKEYIYNKYSPGRSYSLSISYDL